MGRLIMFNMVSLDGYFATPDGGIEWHNAANEEFNDFAVKQLDEAAGLVFGRATYEGMAAYWATTTEDLEVAGRMNAMPKFVFSRTLNEATWNNTTLVKGEAADKASSVKANVSGELFLFGSANLGATMTANRLIDEYRLMVNPVVLGTGLPVFLNLTGELPLTLASSRTFESGNVLLTYHPA